VLPRLLLLFTVVPAIELYLLVRLGQATSAGMVIALVVATGVIGAALARQQGLSLLRRVQDEMAAGRLPAEGLLDGLLILVGGVLLITPGVVTDAVGFCLLIPLTRRAVKAVVRRWIKRQVEAGRLSVRHRSSTHYDFDMDDPP